jgi:lactoylglutathione lyase
MGREGFALPRAHAGEYDRPGTRFTDQSAAYALESAPLVPGRRPRRLYRHLQRPSGISNERPVRVSMLRKIDCVMLRVDDLDAAADYYARVFGLRQLWRDDVSVGMAMAETDAEIVLHTMDLPADRSVHYLVDDVSAAVATCAEQGCVIREAPFDIAIGKCAVLEDPFGNTINILDMSKGPR